MTPRKTKEYSTTPKEVGGKGDPYRLPKKRKKAKVSRKTNPKKKL